MSARREESPEHEELARRFFGDLPPEKLPSADDILRALEIAKGAKFRVSPNLIARYHKAMGGELSAAAAEKGCTFPEPCLTCDVPEDWECWFCDLTDICTTCDAFDCWPGGSADTP